MSQTTFSNMSSPDLMITIQAYAYMKNKINERLMIIQTYNFGGKKIIEEIESLKLKLSRLNELAEALITEYDKRET